MRGIIRGIYLHLVKYPLLLIRDGYFDTVIYGPLVFCAFALILGAWYWLGLPAIEGVSPVHLTLEKYHKLAVFVGLAGFVPSYFWARWVKPIIRRRWERFRIPDVWK